MSFSLPAMILFTAAVVFVGCDGGGPAGDGDGGTDDGPEELLEDENLELCVRNALGNPEGELSPLDLAALTHLECRDMGIASIEGLENCEALTSLALWENQISDLAPLAGLDLLTDLQLGNNSIEDLGSLAGLVGLERLDLSVNGVSDLAPLTGLTSLRWLNLDANRITDVSAIAGLDGLVWLTLERNAVDDLTPLEGIENAGCDIYAQYQDMFQVSPGPGESGPNSQVVSSVAPGFERAEVTSVVGHLIDSVNPGVAAPFLRDPGDIHSLEGELDWQAENTELLPLALASPNQYDAGSCLFMATTGAAEILMNQHVPAEDIQYLGDTDLSERFLMNASSYVPAASTLWLFTDLVYAYNDLGGSMLDRDYPMAAAVEDSYITVGYSWTNDLPDDWEDQMVETPAFERTTIFADPVKNDSSQWNVALMDDAVVERIKHQLRTRGAPVIVVYNHYLYWHADIIVGYDDAVETDGCPMVESSLDYFEQQGATSYVNKIEQHMEDLGGCTSQGIFYVRDSIYDGGDEEPMYEYGGPYPFAEKYSKRIIERTYNWVKFLANHVYVVNRG